MAKGHLSEDTIKFIMTAELQSEKTVQPLPI